ncbi:MAG: hypothetical protein ACJAQ3_004235 [Planctomycetota bacterium]|jgi:hypothetical protein
MIDPDGFALCVTIDELWGGRTVFLGRIPRGSGGCGRVPLELDGVAAGEGLGVTLVRQLKRWEVGDGSGSCGQHDAAALLSMREQQLRKVAESFGSQDVDVKVLMDEDVAKTIVRSTSSSATSFLVLATHGRRGIERTLRGSVAEEVVRHATVPALCMPMAKI